MVFKGAMLRRVLTLNSNNISKTVARRKFKFGNNKFYIFLNFFNLGPKLRVVLVYHLKSSFFVIQRHRTALFWSFVKIPAMVRLMTSVSTCSLEVHL